MPGLIDTLKTPQGFGLLLSSIASAGTGNQDYIKNNLAMNEAFQDMAIKRDALRERQRRKEVLGQLPSLVGALTSGVESQDLGVGADTPAGSVMVDLPMSPQRRASVQGQVLGLLGEIAPDTMAKGLLGALFTPDQGREPPADIRTMQMLGIPLTPAGFEQLNKIKAASTGGDLKGLLDLATLKKLTGELSDASTKRANDELDRTQKFKLAERQTNRNMSDLFELADLNQGLKDTPLQPGLPLADWRRAIVSGKVALAESLGSKTQDQLRQQISDYDRLRKGLNNIIINNTGRFGSNFTNQMETLLENASANPNIMPEAIDHILGQLAERLSDDADVMGYKLDSGKDPVMAFIKRMNASRPQGARPLVDMTGAVDELGKDMSAARETIGGAVDRVREATPGAVAAGKQAVEAAAVTAKPYLNRAADIARLTIDKINAITDDDIRAMTEEQKRALLNRINELKGRP